MNSIIGLRCYIEQIKDKKEERRRSFENDDVQRDTNQSIVLVFDTETSSDKYQNLLFGSCGIWVAQKLAFFYVFYQDDLNQSDIDKITEYARTRDYKLIPLSEFLDVFFAYVHQAAAICVCLNTPFDLSRLMTSWAPSRKYKEGFTFSFDNNPAHPKIRISHRNSTSSFLEFGKVLRNVSRRKYDSYRGCFVDLRTATFALTNNSYSLETALSDFGCALNKTRVKGHGKITAEYLAYNTNDTLSTYELYLKVIKRFEEFKIERLPSEVFSPASIGKYYLEKIGIAPFQSMNPDFPKELLGYVMSSYFGGKVELRIRRVPTRVTCLDATSMYPTVYVLEGMDRFLKAETIEYVDSTSATQQFIDNFELESVKDTAVWKNLNVLCEILPEDDFLPVRSRFGSDNVYNNVVTFLKSIDGTSLWYGLPDILGSKLLTGKNPVIKRAITFSPVGVQEGLKEIQISDEVSVAVDEDIIKKAIEQRIRIKKTLKNLGGNSKEKTNTLQSFLKVLANSTAYGEFIETNTEIAEGIRVAVSGLSQFESKPNILEKYGKAFNPIIATFVTSGARLILAAAEAILKKQGSSLVYCDTDSVFVAAEISGLIKEFFKPLNPYSEEVDFFKIAEDEYGKPLENVWFYGISSKRYCLYDLDNSGKPAIRAFSSHGLGHLLGIEHQEWWEDIVRLHYRPEDMADIFRKYASKYAICQLTVSKPDIAKRLEFFNSGNPMNKQIKPFNFVTVGLGHRVNDTTGQPIIPLLPYVSPTKNGKVNKDFLGVPFMPFVDYKTGEVYPRKGSLPTEAYWKPLLEVFEDYIDHPEAKFDGDTGQLHHKHLLFDKSSIEHIGKETNNLELSEVIGVQEEDVIKYHKSLESFPDWKERILQGSPKQTGLARHHMLYIKRCLRAGKKIRLSAKTKASLVEFLRGSEG